MGLYCQKSNVSMLITADWQSKQVTKPVLTIITIKRCYSIYLENIVILNKQLLYYINSFGVNCKTQFFSLTSKKFFINNCFLLPTIVILWDKEMPLKNQVFLELGFSSQFCKIISKTGDSCNTFVRASQDDNCTRN